MTPTDIGTLVTATVALLGIPSAAWLRWKKVKRDIIAREDARREQRRIANAVLGHTDEQGTHHPGLKEQLDDLKPNVEAMRETARKMTNLEAGMVAAGGTLEDIRADGRKTREAITDVRDVAQRALNGNLYIAAAVNTWSADVHRAIGIPDLRVNPIDIHDLLNGPTDPSRDLSQEADHE